MAPSRLNTGLFKNRPSGKEGVVFFVSRVVGEDIIL